MERRYQPTQQELTEQKPKVDRTGIILGQFLDDKHILTRLLRPDGNFGIQKRAQKVIENLSPEESTVVTKELISGMAKDDDVWNVDRRDGALMLLSYVNVNRVQPYSMAESYTSAVSQMDETSDPLGPVDTLLEAGKLIARHLPKDAETNRQIKDAWKAVGEKFGDDPVWHNISHKVKDIEGYLQGETDIFIPEQRQKSREELREEEYERRKEFFLDQGFSEQWIKKVAKRKKFLLPVKTVTNRFDYLYQRGFANPQKMVKLLPQILEYTTGNIDKKIEGLQEKGFTEPQKMIQRFPQILGLSSNNIDRRLKVITRLKHTYNFKTTPTKTVEQLPYLLTTNINKIFVLARILRDYKISPEDLSLYSQQTLINSNLEDTLIAFTQKKEGELINKLLSRTREIKKQKLSTEQKRRIIKRDLKDEKLKYRYFRGYPETEEEKAEEAFRKKTNRAKSKAKGGNPELDEQVIELARAGHTRGEITDILGLDNPRKVSVALQRIRRQGIDIKLQTQGDRNKEKSIEDVRRLRTQGMTYPEISDELNIPFNTVMWYWKQAA